MPEAKITGEIETARNEFNWWWWLFGTLASSISLISLIQKILNVGLSPVLQDFIAYYRGLTYPFFNAVLQLFSVSAPDWYKDAYIISFLALMTAFRIASEISPRLRPRKRHSVAPNRSKLFELTVGTIVALLLSVLLFGVFYIVYLSLMSFGYARESRDKVARAGNPIALRSFLVMALVAIAFFSVNFNLR